MDWVEVAMDRLDRITSRYTDLAESDYSHYTKAQKYYNKALENTDKEIKAAKESMYLLVELDLPLLLLQDSMVEELVFLLVEVVEELQTFV